MMKKNNFFGNKKERRFDAGLLMSSERAQEDNILESFNLPSHSELTHTKLNLIYKSQMPSSNNILEYSQKLSKFINLEKLVLAVNFRMENKDFKILMKSLYGMNRLKKLELNLQHNSLSNESLKRLGKLSSQLKSLKSFLIVISENKDLTGEGLVQFSEIFKASFVERLYIHMSLAMIDSNFIVFCQNLNNQKHLSSLQLQVDRFLSCLTQTNVEVIGTGLLLLKQLQRLELKVSLAFQSTRLIQNDLTIHSKDKALSLCSFSIYDKLTHSYSFFNQLISNYCHVQYLQCSLDKSINQIEFLQTLSKFSNLVCLHLEVGSVDFGQSEPLEYFSFFKQITSLQTLYLDIQLSNKLALKQQFTLLLSSLPKLRNLGLSIGNIMSSDVLDLIKSITQYMTILQTVNVHVKSIKQVTNQNIVLKRQFYRKLKKLVFNKSCIQRIYIPM